jgi:hypothetical protein
MLLKHDAKNWKETGYSPETRTRILEKINWMVMFLMASSCALDNHNWIYFKVEPKSKARKDNL